MELDTREYNSDPVQCYNKFYGAVMQSSFIHFEPKQSTQPPKERVKPYINSECKQAIAKARRARQQWHKSHKSAHMKNNLNRLEAICSRTLQKAKDSHKSNYISSIESGKEPKKLWSFTKSIMGTNNDDRRTTIVFTNDDNTTASPSSSASMLLHQYSLPSLRPPPDYRPPALGLR